MSIPGALYPLIGTDEIPDFTTLLLLGFCKFKSLGKAKSA